MAYLTLRCRGVAWCEVLLTSQAEVVFSLTHLAGLKGVARFAKWCCMPTRMGGGNSIASNRVSAGGAATIHVRH